MPFVPYERYQFDLNLSYRNESILFYSFYYYLTTSSVSKKDIRGVLALATAVQRSCVGCMPSVPAFKLIIPPGPSLWSWSVAETVGVSVRSRFKYIVSAVSSF